MDIEFKCNGDAVTLLVDAIRALDDDLVKIVRGPAWIGETVCASTYEQRTCAVARLLAAVHNQYREGPIRIHIRGNAMAGFESHISYDYRDPFDELTTQGAAR